MSDLIEKAKEVGLWEQRGGVWMVIGGEAELRRFAELVAGTQPEATAPAQHVRSIAENKHINRTCTSNEHVSAVQDLSAAILALPLPEIEFMVPSSWESECYARGALAMRKAAAALASSANALSAGDRVDAEPFDIAPAEVRKVMRAPLAHGAWIERTGPLDLWALYNEHGFVRMLHRFEIEFVDGAIGAAILQSQKGAE